MRFRLTLLVVLCTAVLFFADRPQRWHATCASVGDWAQHLWYDKEIEITGTHFLPAEKVRALLPLQKSVPYWFLNGSLIEAELLQNPIIQRASVARCRTWSRACFRVAIEERVPAFFAWMGTRAWMVGNDGGVIKPVEPAWLRAYVSSGLAGDAAQLKIPVIGGLAAEDSSPDIVRARFAHVRRALDLIEKTVGIPVSSLELGDKQEMRVRFFGLGLTAIFDVSPEDIWGREPGILVDRAERLKRLLDEFGDKRDLIESVDLAFEKVAVVKARQDLPAERPVRAQSGSR